MTGIQLKAIRERLGLSAAVFDDHSAIKAVDRRKYEAACARRTAYSDIHRATCSQVLDERQPGSVAGLITLTALEVERSPSPAETDRLGH
jgi:hypothetical protein